MRSVFFSPVFNQIEELPRLLDELRSATLPCDEILLINNGSSDGSEELVRKSGYEYIDVPRNKGVGYSMMLAIEWALEREFDVLGGFASNGKMSPSEMGMILEPIVAGEADYVTGSRFLPGGAFPHLPLFRRVTIPLVNAFVRGVTGARLTDATCGYRAYRLYMMNHARFDWRATWLHTYAMEYYLYAKVLLDSRLRTLEVPITMRYPASGRYSKIRAGRDWYSMLKPWLAARLDGKGFDWSGGAEGSLLT